MQRDKIDADASVGAWILRGQRLGNAGQFSLRLRQRYAVLQSGYNKKIVTAVIRQFCGTQSKRDPDIVIRVRKMKCRRHYPQHGVTFAVQAYGLPKDLRILAKTARPQPVANRND